MKTRTASDKRVIDAATRRKLWDALNRDYQVYAEAYCDNTHCSAREVVIRIKDHDRALRNHLEKFYERPLACPLCSQPMKLHYAITSKEHQAREEQDSRHSVNVQMRQRDYHAAHGNDALFFMTADDISDDRLPPTPDNWFGPTTETGAPPKRKFVVKRKE